MAALTGYRNTEALEVIRVLGNPAGLTVKLAEVLQRGSLLMMDANGEVLSGATATGQKALGRCPKKIDNTADGEVTEVEQGVFEWENSAGDPIPATAQHGDIVYIEDDQTVSATDGGSTQSPAGKFYGWSENGKPFVLTSLEVV